MKQRSNLVGRIILSNFLEQSVEKFITFVSNIEGSPLYKRLTEEGIVVPKLLPDANVLRRKNATALAKDSVIAKIAGEGSLSVYYTIRKFSIEYQIKGEKLSRYVDTLELTDEERNDLHQLLNKLRRINTRNLIVHQILKGVVEYQRDYFASNDDINLVPLTRAQLARFISDSKDSRHGADFTIDASRTSRAIRGLSIINQSGEEIPIRLLFPSRRDMAKRCVRVVLNQEKEDISGGKITKPHTDKELRRKIKESFGLIVTRREVAYCRKELGILPYFERNGYVYHTLAADFSQIYPLTIPSIDCNAPAGSGVYELCLNGDALEYPTGFCKTFYIGSASNLRKRLLSHLSSSSKNGGISKFTRKGNCVFRYLPVPQRWSEEEKRFYNLFIAAYGDSPLCNHISPKRAGVQIGAKAEG